MSDHGEVQQSGNERPTALVAESDRALRELLRLHLNNGGYDVVVAPDAIVAGRTLLQRPQAIDFLVIDAQLPYMSGLDFVATLIADSSLRLIPTIVIATREQEAQRADVLGVPALIAPFRAEQLLDLVRTSLAGGQDRLPAAGPRRSMRQRLDELTIPIPVEAARRRRVVIADDEPDTVTSLMAILSDEGHSVFGSHRAWDVLPEVRNHKPDAVILDIDMPGISGFAIAREIREMFGDGSPLLIAVSGKWFGQTDRMLAQMAGFDCFLQKPCAPDALLGLLQGRRPDLVPRGGPECGPSLTFQT